MLITHAKIWKIIGFLSLTNFWFFSISSFPCFLPQRGHSTREIKNERTQSLHLQCSSSVFELWCWRRLLRVPWTARRSNKSILKEISLECSLEELMLKLKLQYFGHLMRRVGSLEKTLMLGGIGGRRKRGWQRMRWLDDITYGHEFEWTPGVGDGQGGLACCDSWGHKESDTTEGLNWTERQRNG